MYKHLLNAGGRGKIALCILFEFSQWISASNYCVALFREKNVTLFCCNIFLCSYISSNSLAHPIVTFICYLHTNKKCGIYFIERKSFAHLVSQYLADEHVDDLIKLSINILCREKIKTLSLTLHFDGLGSKKNKIVNSIFS